ncbi:uncharacterized protein LOC143301349 [Babylonia areolata]|uniref:uncharacterized protein LOC143301349 n=1 Tax=Babylonia areolata TaxID=304850 RepID=UPI003FD61EFE
MDMDQMNRARSDMKHVPLLLLSPSPSPSPSLPYHHHHHHHPPAPFSSPLSPWRRSNNNNMESWYPHPHKPHHHQRCSPSTRISDAQARLLLCRRWSTPSFRCPPSSPSPPPGPPLPPPLDLYSHYVDGVNENEAVMREHRKSLFKMAEEGRSRGDRLRAAYEEALTADAAAAAILAWSREKYKDWARKQPRELGVVEEGGPPGADRSEAMTPASALTGTLTRRNTISRLTARSRDSLVRMSSKSSLSASDTEEEKPKKKKNIRTFWWYCGVIKALCKLGLDMQRLSMRRTEQTALSELYFVSVGGTMPGEEEEGGEEEGQILFFDKTLFTRKRAACRVPEWAQNLMIRRPEDRKPEEVQRLKNLLMSMRSFREKYTDEMRTKICQVVRYTRCDKGRVVLRQGHLGLYFYFIFSGSVFIQIDLKDARTGQSTPSTENIIRTGESFGEIALLGDGKRSATVICREPTELCQIDKSSFLEICPDIFQQQLDEKIVFARKFELFQPWDEESVKQLCFLSQVLYIPHGRVLELDWSQAQYVYFIMRGRVSMIKEFDVDKEEDVAEEKAAPAEDWDWEEEVKMEEEADRFSVLLKSAKGAQLARQGTPTGKRFACVGTLRAGQTTDLRILSVKPVKVPSITLLSEGARVLRMATRNFDSTETRKRVEEYLRKGFTPRAIPSTKAIIQRYRRDSSWRTFRHCVMGTLVKERAGHFRSTLPASSKGSTGWARWPGFDPLAGKKAVLLSERGGRSEIDNFPVATLPLAHIRQRRRSARKTGRDEKLTPPKISDYRRSLTNMSSGSGTSRNGESRAGNEPRLVMYPPRKQTVAFMRKNLDEL